MTTRFVMVNGVEVQMFDDTVANSLGTSPMRATLQYFVDNPHVECDPDDVAALRAAGVKWLPLYRTEAEEAGIVWEEVS